MIRISSPYPVIMPNEFLDYVVHIRTSYSVDLAFKHRPESQLSCLPLLFVFQSTARKFRGDTVNQHKAAPCLC